MFKGLLITFNFFFFLNERANLTKCTEPVQLHIYEGLNYDFHKGAWLVYQNQLGFSHTVLLDSPLLFLAIIHKQIQHQYKYDGDFLIFPSFKCHILDVLFPLQTNLFFHFVV